MKSILDIFKMSGSGRLHYQEFTTSGTFTPSAALLAAGGQVMIDLRAGGGGYGFNYYGSGGGNGGNSKHIAPYTVTGPTAITIGAGGTSSSGGNGAAGGSSSFGSLTVIGAGGGQSGVGGGYGTGNEGSSGETEFFSANYGWTGPTDIKLQTDTTTTNSGAGGSSTTNGSNGYCCVYWFESEAVIPTNGPQLMRTLVHPSDQIITDFAGYQYSIQPWADLNPITGIAHQSQLPGQVIMWAGFTKGIGFSQFYPMVDEAIKYPNFTHTYVYDEVFWNGSGIQIGLDEPQILAAARYSTSKGLRPVIVILPDVIMDVAFALTDINAYAVIGIDLYPSIRPVGPGQIGTCKFNQSSSYYTNLLYCSTIKLRAMGFTGEIWYVYQAFGLTFEPVQSFQANLEIQKATIEMSIQLGQTGIVPWGLYLGAAEIQAEPYLYPLHGTSLEPLVNPQMIFP